MSPLARILMAVLHKGSWVASILLVLFAGILIYQRWVPGSGFAFQKGDFGFLTVMAAMFLLAIYLVRAIRKELEASQSKDGT
jgi:hypothetical protein